LFLATRAIAEPHEVRRTSLIRCELTESARGPECL